MNPQDNYSPSPLTPSPAPAGSDPNWNNNAALNPAQNAPQPLSTDPLVAASANNPNYNMTSAPVAQPSPNQMPTFATPSATNNAINNLNSMTGGPADPSATPGINGAPIVNDMSANSAPGSAIPAASPAQPAPDPSMTPVPPFNPFDSASSQNQPATKAPKQPGRHHTLNLILGLLAVVFAVAAVIFCVLWLQAPKTKKPQDNANNPGSSEQQPPAEDDGEYETILSCRVGGDVPSFGEDVEVDPSAPTGMGLTGEARYRNDQLEQFAMGVEMTFASNEAAESMLESMRADFEQQAATYRDQYGLTNIGTSFARLNNIISTVVYASGDDIRNNHAYGVVFGLYPGIETTDPTAVELPAEAPDTSMTAIRKLYESGGMTCEEKREKITEGME